MIDANEARTRLNALPVYRPQCLVGCSENRAVIEQMIREGYQPTAISKVFGIPRGSVARHSVRGKRPWPSACKCEAT